MSLDVLAPERQTMPMARTRQKRPRTNTSVVLRRWMNQNNLSYAQAAAQLDKTIKTIDRWLAGESEPWDNEVKRIAPVMGLKTEDFYPETAPINVSLESRVDVLEGQFSEGFEDLDERVSALEQLFGAAPGDGKAAREQLAEALEALLSGEIAPTLAKGRTGRAAKPRAARTRRATKPPTAG